MFTGIVEEKGVIKSILRTEKSVVLAVEAKKILGDLEAGDSVAVNGVCLTVTAIKGFCFYADVMPETLSRSSLGMLAQGSHVNLERAMLAGGRFGGHMVSGHIDGVGRIAAIRKDGIAVWYTVKTVPKIMQYIIEKGSITMDGISLTVARSGYESFQVSVIPHTADHTTIQEKRIGSIVNLENDLAAKYLEKMMHNSLGITSEYLIKSGF